MHKILRKKLFCAKKVTTLPALTVVSIKKKTEVRQNKYIAYLHALTVCTKWLYVLKTVQI